MEEIILLSQAAYYLIGALSFIVTIIIAIIRRTRC